MSDEQDGHANSRLDRLEGLMELLIEEHMKFTQEHKQLLTAGDPDGLFGSAHRHCARTG